MRYPASEKLESLTHLYITIGAMIKMTPTIVIAMETPSTILSEKKKKNRNDITFISVSEFMIYEQIDWFTSTKLSQF